MIKPVQYIEIDLPVCGLTYGTSPCTAALGTTGTRKCFNSRATCQDLDNYDEETSTLRLAVGTLELQPGIVAIPNIQKISYTPPKIQLGQSIGVRSTITITCKDHPFPDTGPGGDKYVSDRDYTPYHRGTFWGKILARYPYLRERELRWYIGTTKDTLDGMEVRRFVIERIEGPNTDGTVQIIAKDPLALLDDKRTLAPKVSKGALSATIDDTDTTLTLKPEGIVAAEYDLSTPYWVAVGGDEIMKVTSVSTGSDQLTVERGQYNTEAIDREIDERVQVCLQYDGEPPQNILEDLLTNYVPGNAFADYIEKSNWDREIDEFLGGPSTINYSALIPEPTAVNKLCNEVCRQSGISLWWDDSLSQIQLQVLRRVVQSQTVYDDNVILRGSFSQKENPKRRISQAWLYYAQINPVEEERENNYREVVVDVSLESETNYGSPSVERIFSRWIPFNGFVVAARATNRMLVRFSIPPRTFTFSLLRGSGVQDPILGGGARLKPFFLQDDTGGQEEIDTQIIEVQPNESAWQVTAEEYTRSDVEELEPSPNLWVIPIVSSQNNVNIRSAFNSLGYDINDVQDGDEIRCEIRSGVRVGSSSTSQYALRTGTGWPSGATLVIEVFSNAVIAGKAGDGGEASASRSSSGATSVSTSNPTNGGPGLLVESSCEIDNGGIIGGGGGGGGAAAATATTSTGATYVTAVGGSGGGGRPSGSGGDAETSAPSDTFQESPDGRNGTLLEGGSRAIAGASWGSAAGGAGGDLGESGGDAEEDGSTGNQSYKSSTTNGASPGNAVQGDSLVTWTTLGDIRGARVG